jgi:hypothetical protein
MNAEQRRRYLKERTMRILTDLENKVYASYGSRVVDSNAVLTDKQKYDLIAYGHASLKRFTDLSFKYGNPKLFDAYQFQAVAEADASNKKLEATRNNHIARIRQKVQETEDILYLTKIEEGSKLIEEIQEFADKFLENINKEKVK